MVIGTMLEVIERFHDRAASQISGKTARRTEIGKWEWPPVAEALETAGVCPIEEYIQQIQDNVAAQVDCRSIY